MERAQRRLVPNCFHLNLILYEAYRRDMDAAAVPLVALFMALYHGHDRTWVNIKHQQKNGEGKRGMLKVKLDK